jgi:hypothetical protein
MGPMGHMGLMGHRSRGSNGSDSDQPKQTLSRTTTIVRGFAAGHSDCAAHRPTARFRVKHQHDIDFESEH